MQTKKQNIVKINGQDYVIKYSLRSVFLFESITNRPFEITSTLDNYIYIYCVILANNKDKELTFSQFIDAIDEDSTIIPTFESIMQKEKERQEMFEDETVKKKTPKR